MPDSTSTIHSQQPKWQRHNTIAVLVLILLGGWLRLAELDLVSITADEGIHGLLARNVALLDFEKFPAVGLPSVGVRNSALFIYLLSVPNFLWLHPLSGAAFIALLHVWALWLVYSTGWRWFGSAAAWIATLLFVCSPWAVLYARNMWPPSALTPFALSLVWLGLRWYETGSRKLLFWMIVLSFVLPQIHFSGFCGPFWLLMVLITGRNRINASALGTLILASIAGVATWAQWIHWQHFSNKWQDFTQILTAAKGASEFSLTKLFTYYFDLLSSEGLNYWFRTPVGELPSYFPTWLATSSLAIAICITLCFLASIAIQSRNTIGRLLIAWCLLPLILLLVIRPNVHPHYEFIAFPIPFVLIAGMLTSKAKWLTGFALVGSSLVSIVFLVTIAGWRQFIVDGRLDGADRYQLSYRQRFEAVDSVIKDSGPVIREIAGPFSGQQPAYSLVHTHEIARRSVGKWRRDSEIRYWMDELEGEGLPKEALADLGKYPPFVINARIERFWNVGPTRIFVIKGTPAE